MSGLAEQRLLARRLRQRGHTYVEVAVALRRQYALNYRVAFRMANGWSQRDAAEEWNKRWLDDQKTAKNFSYWEQWPGSTGHAPSLETVRKLAELYRCRVADLFADLGDYRSEDPATAGRASFLRQRQEISNREAPHGWYVKSLATWLRLDLDSPIALEDRTVIAARDGLQEIVTSMSVPRRAADASPRHDLEVELLVGGALVLREQPHESQFRHVVALPRPLRTGDEHFYRLSIRIPPGQMMSQHAVQIPLQRSDSYQLTVRFSLDRPPTAIWLLDGVPPAVLRDREPRSRQVEADRFGEITVRFEDLLQGQAYGLRWQF